MKTLERQLELPAVIAISISAMLGSGIFVLPGLAAAKAGPSIWLAYLLAGIFVLPAAVSKAELATAMPTSGGSYVYLDRAFGPLAGTVVGLGLWLSLLLKSAFALVGMGAYLAAFADVEIRSTAVGLIGILVLLNIRGVRRVGQAQLIMVIVSIVALVGMVVVGTFRFNWGRFDPPLTNGTVGLLAATALVVVAYDGVTKVAAIAEEIRRPGRNLPAGILLSLVVVAAVYGTVTLVLAGNIPLAQLQGDLRPIFTLAEQEGGPTIGILVAVIGALTMISMANAGILAASRFPFAMSRDDLLPARLGRLHHRHLTPIAAIILSGVTMAAAILLLDVERIAKLASSFVILIFMAENLTVIVLRETRVQWYKPDYRSPLYPWMQIFGFVSGFALLAVMGMLVLAGIAGVALPGLILFAFYGRKRTVRRGVVAQRGPRQALLRGTDHATAESSPIEGSAEVLVSLFGKERSPEMLVELGTALATGKRTQVVHLTEIPEQTALGAVLEEDVSVQSLTRRLGAMSETMKVPIEFDAVASRDIIKTVHQLSQNLRTEWLVVEWTGRTDGGFTVENPLGWLRANVGCNLAVFYDVGVRYIRKILVYAEPGPHDSLVVSTADHLAEIHGADLTFIRFVPKDAPKTALHSAADYLDQVRDLSSAQTRSMIVQGKSEHRAIADATGAFDLLVMGAAPSGQVLRRILGTERDALTKRAACSVLRVQQPRARTHEALARPRKQRMTADVPPLMELLVRDCVQAKLDPIKKDALFHHFAKSFESSVGDVPATEIVAALWEREQMQNTAVGDGMALPHATIPTAGPTRLGIFTTSAPASYQTPDGEGVDIFFVTLGAPRDRQMHLLLLAAVAQLVMSTPLLERLREAESTDEIVTILERCSSEIDD